jgi:hypothetical protein
VLPNKQNQTITSDTDFLKLCVPSYLSLSHKLIELSRKELPRSDTASESVLSVKLRRYSDTAVMTIKESLNIAKRQVPFRGDE